MKRDSYAFLIIGFLLLIIALTSVTALRGQLITSEPTPTLVPTFIPTPLPPSTVTPFPEVNFRPCQGITTDYVNARSGAGLEYEPVELLNIDTFLLITRVSDDGNWYYVYNGVKGWVSAEFIQVTAQCSY